MTINQVVAGAAALTSSSTSFTATVPGAGQTFTVADATGYPSSGRFVAQLSRANSDEEKVLVASRSGTTFTVETRGYDGTSAQSHTDPTVNLILPATVITALIDHADGTGSEGTDPHSTKLLNNTRHDTTSRHALGTSIPVSATTPTTIEPDDVGTVGVANAVARSDHEHPVAAATPGAITAATTTAAEGTATSFARSDHRHMITTATPVAISTALGEGTSTSFARADHAHELATGTIDTVGFVTDGLITPAKLNDSVALAVSGVATSHVDGPVSVNNDSIYVEMRSVGIVVPRACMAFISVAASMRTQVGIAGDYDWRGRVQVDNADHPSGAAYSQLDGWVEVTSVGAAPGYDRLDATVFWPLAAGTFTVDLDLLVASGSAGNLTIFARKLSVVLVEL